MAGTTTVSSANFKDSQDAVVNNATVWFQPCIVPTGIPVAYRAGGSDQGQRTSDAVPVQCSGGIFSITLEDTSLTLPVNIGYLVTAIDNVTGLNRLGPGYIIQPYGATWSFDDFQPNLAGMATTQYGPAGTIAIRNVSAGPVPEVYNTGTTTQAILDIVLPQGIQGAQGIQGVPGSNSVVGSLSSTFGRQTSTADGSATAFAMPVAGLPLVFRNGLLQESGPDYTQSGTTITFAYAPNPGDRITIVVFPAS